MTEAEKLEAYNRIWVSAQVLLTTDTRIYEIRHLLMWLKERSGQLKRYLILLEA